MTFNFKVHELHVRSTGFILSVDISNFGRAVYGGDEIYGAVISIRFQVYFGSILGSLSWHDCDCAKRHIRKEQHVF